MFRTEFNPDSKIWSGPNVLPLFSSFVSLGQILCDSLDRCPDLIGQICHDDGSQKTNGEIQRDAIRVALNLKAIGLQTGDVIAMVAKNNKNDAAIVIGSLLVGVAVNCSDFSFRVAQIRDVYQIIQPKLVICDQEKVDDLKCILKDLENNAILFVHQIKGEISVQRSVDRLLAPHFAEDTFVAPFIGDSRKIPALILSSSGTTGNPKTIALSHASLIFRGMTWMNKSQERFFTFSSLYWLTGIVGMLSCAYRNMVRIFTAKPYNSDLFLEIVDKHKVNHLMSAPSHMTMLLQNPSTTKSKLSSITQFRCGGTHVPEDNARRIEALLENGTVKICYGMSEVGTIVSRSDDCQIYSSGQLFQGIQVKVIDAGGVLLGVNEIGELCFKCPYSILGYYKRPDLNKLLIVNGWLHSADVGYFDELGNLFIVDRKSDLINWNGYEIYPSEIESVILRIKDVIMVFVAGVSDCSGIAALILRKKDSELDESDVHLFIQNNLPEHQWLKGGVYFVEKLPLTAAGKIWKQKSKELVNELYEHRKNL